MNELQDKVAIVTGAGDGIGLAIARRYLAAGAKVVALDIDPDKLSREYGDDPNVVTIAKDVSDMDTAEMLVATAVDRFGGLNIVVNAAGVFRYGSLTELSQEDWDKVMAVNLTAPFRICIAAVPALTAAGDGRIVNIASASAVRGVKGMGIYSISKHGVAGLTVNLAADLAEYGITANYLMPGVILTGLTRPLVADPTWEEDFKRQGFLGRIGTAEEVAEAAYYLVGPNSGFTTGTGIAVDGGGLARGM